MKDVEKAAGFLTLFADNVSAGMDVEPVTWIRENVVDQQSARSSHIDFTLSPFLLDPIDKFLNDGTVKHINLMAPTGSGKSTLFVGLLNYLIANDAGNTLVAFQNEQETSDFAETRLFPTFRDNKALKDLLPKKRHAARKTEILFPHMNLWMVSATKGQLQSKSCRYLIGDEMWAWEKGMVREFLARHHDRFNRKILMVSQGGDKGTDWVDEYGKGRIHHYHWQCPGCQGWNTYDWRDVIYSKEENIDWERFKESVKMVCPRCSHEIEDTVNNRRRLASSGKYVFSGNTSALPEIVSYNFNALACYWVSWADLAVEWILANQKKRKGDIEPLKKFIQKRLAQNIVDLGEKDDVLKIPLTAESMEGYTVEDERARFLTVDVQKGHFWHTVYAVDAGGSFHLLSEGRLETLEDIECKQSQFNVPDHCVALDCAFDTDAVRKICGLHHWFSMNGTVKEEYLHKIKSRGVKLIYAPLEQHIVEGVKCLHFNFSSQRAKDVLAARIKSGNWKVPHDVSSEYIKQMQAESKQESIDKRTGRVSLKWLASGNNSHMWDCSCMAVIFAMIHRVI